MKRILLMVLRNLWFVPYGWFKLCYTAAHVEKIHRRRKISVLKNDRPPGEYRRSYHHRCLWSGKHPEAGWIHVFPNHQGLYDVLAILEVCPRPFSVVMKKEVENCTVLKTGLCLHESHSVRSKMIYVRGCR